MIRHFNDSMMVCLLTIIAVGFAQFIPTANAQTPLKFGWSAVTSYAADFDGDGKADPALYHDATGYLYVWLSAINYAPLLRTGPFLAP